MAEGAYRYWGKARRPEEMDGDEYHLLPYHCLDVAAVAAAWWDSSANLRRSFCVNQALAESQMRAWVLFFISLHDLGKIDLHFQLKVARVWYEMNAECYGEPQPAQWSIDKFNHGTAGIYWYGKDKSCNREPTLDVFSSFDEPEQDKLSAEWLAWLAEVCGHHGFIRSYSQIYQGMEHNQAQLSNEQAERDKQARSSLILAMEALFLTPAGLAIDDNPPKAVPLLLAGFCSVCDWLGSQPDPFNFCASPEHNLQDYFSMRYPQALQVLQKVGLLEQVAGYHDIREVLEAGFEPRQLQTLVDVLPIEPSLTLIEAPTGSGKTETALAIAWRILDAGLADSLIFALPTQATANAMLERIDKFATKLFYSPNIVLAHGHARFNKLFEAIKLATQQHQGKEEATAQCVQWLAQSKKRVFLGQIGVCTVDQVLISVLPVKHRFVRQFGVNRSIVIIDEIHAYSTYMYGLLEQVLRNQRTVGGSAILLSATLTQQQRQALLNAWGGAELESRDYPLVSWTNGFQALPFRLTNEHLPPLLDVWPDVFPVSDMVPNQFLLDQMIAAAKKGAQVAVICNLVDVAQTLYQQLKETSELDIQLFHARYTFIDRQVKEVLAIKTFGHNSKSDRRVGRILIGTQVLQESLDLDFDWMITQLCPGDLLFQRIGRLHRHQRIWRPKDFSLAKITVLVPTESDFGVHKYIYGNSLVMWRTWQRLLALKGEPIHFPAAYRDWIDAIYSVEEMDEPEWVKSSYKKFEEQEGLKRSSARAMLRWAEDCALEDENSTIQAVTRDGEMSLSVVPYMITAQGKQLLAGAVFEQLNEREQLEVRVLNTINVPASWRSLLSNKANEDGCFWLAGTLVNGIWKNNKFSYSAEIGLEKIK